MAGVILDPDAYDRDPRYRRGMHAAIRRIAHEIDSQRLAAAARTAGHPKVAPVGQLEVVFFGRTDGLISDPATRVAMLRRIERELVADGEPIRLEEYIFKAPMENR